METSRSIGQRLMEARKAAGFSQEQVAIVLGLPRPTISYIESGDRQVKAEELSKFSQLYHKPVDFFLHGEITTGFEKEREKLAIHFRAQGLTAKDEEEVWQGYDLCSRYGELEELLAIRREALALPSLDLEEPRSKAQATEQGIAAAEKIRALLKLGDSPVANMGRLLESQGIRVADCHFSDSVSGVFVYTPRVGSCVLLNPKNLDVRRNFTLAHEFAHAVFDRNKTAQVDLVPQEMKPTPLETRANVFAACFLISESALARFLREVKIESPEKHQFSIYDICRIAEYFNVSYQAVLFRLRSLGYLSVAEMEDFMRQDWKEISRALGKRLSEVMEGCQPGRGAEREIDAWLSKERLRALAIEAYRRSLISVGKLAEYLDMDLAETKAALRTAKITPYEE